MIEVNRLQLIVTIHATLYVACPRPKNSSTSLLVEAKMLDNVQRNKSSEIASKWWLHMCHSSVTFFYCGHLLLRNYKPQNESDEILMTIYGANLNCRPKVTLRVAFQIMVFDWIVRSRKVFESHFGIIVFVKHLFRVREFDTQFRCSV